MVFSFYFILNVSFATSYSKIGKSVGKLTVHFSRYNLIIPCQLQMRKSPKKRSSTVSFKLKVVEVAEENGECFAAKMFRADRKRPAKVTGSMY